MTTPFNVARPPLSWGRSGGVVTLVEGASFCVCDQAGDITPDHGQGLFFRDARLISRWELHVDGQRIEPLSVQPTDPYAGVFVCRPHPADGRPDGHLVVVRRRLVGPGMREDVTLRNFAAEATAVTLMLTVESDFADLFAVKEGREFASGSERVTTGQDRLAIWPENRDDGLGVVIQTEGANPVVTPNSLIFQVVIEPGAEWHACLQVLPVVDGEELPPRFPRGEPVEASVPAQRLTRWREGAPRLRTDHRPLARAAERTAADLGSLRIFDPQRPDLPVVAAGAPWYMTLFGRDSLLTAWMALIVDPQLAVGTLHVLAELQGNASNALSEEQPGRIMHELRHGSGFGTLLAGNSLYYGTADATPLFVMLLGEAYRWGLADEVRPLTSHANRALAWIKEYGDRDGDGFVEYRRATDKGLANQGWKDSWDAVSFRDGRLAEPPIALCEVQAYVYGAFRARAEMARADSDAATAELYDKRADELKQLFNDAFWLPDGGYLAFALDGQKRPVDAMTSNMGHCLWTGIVDEDKAEQIADHLLSPEMFTGWGVRTLSRADARYNPVSYHNGSVWPHDTAIVAAGLARYGFTDHAKRIAEGLLDAAERFDGRLPELFCGFDRDDFAAPVSYPSSCSPQAWAAAAPLLLIRSLLGFSPSVPDGVLQVTPAIPPHLGTIELDGVPLAGGRVRVTAHIDSADVTGLPPSVRLLTG
jgi:glycogen debranching enzyme